ncbi:MAG: uroporphyrinogen-III C-methyltransferase [Pirellulales bacterium]
MKDRRSKSSVGKVYLVGAGPGDAGLITLRGMECLARADVVLYDYLVNPQILEHAPAQAEQVCLGRHGHGRIMSQEEIGDRMIEAAVAGLTVVRLKGGDPIIFARAAEELERLAAANVPFEIVPGVTAAVAAGSYAGIPLTHRDAASCVAFVTGQERPGKGDDGMDYKALARFPGTLVFYMGVTTAPVWSRALVEAGRSPETPAAVVRRCSWPDQAIIRCTLGKIAEVLAAGQMRPPALVIVGDVAAMPSTADWFSQRPLFGTTVLVTRPRGQASELRGALEELGAAVLIQPAIEISPPDDSGPLDRAVAELDTFDWIVFSSANGVEAFMTTLLSRALDARALGGARLAAIGPATAHRLLDFHLRVDVQPEDYRAEALAEALAPQAKGRRFLLIRASRGREVLAERLTAAGGHVQQVVAYSSTDVNAPDPEVAEALAAGKIDWITVTSSAIARSLIGMFGDGLGRTKIASISPITSDVLRELGHSPAVEAQVYTTEGVVRAIVKSVTSSDARR